MFDSRDFSTLKLISAVNCSEFVMKSEIERARSIAQVSILSNANSLQIQCDFPL